MSLSATKSRIWDEATSDDAVSRFEAAWRAAYPSRRPDPLAFATQGSAADRLALLRADLGLRWESGEKAEATRYRGLGLSDDAMVALAYEEFSLREEHGETPAPADFYERYPEIVKPLRRVLEIHDLVGSAHAASTASLNNGPSCSAVAFPEAGQTIAGFHLVEELGRGGFARVFLARERQLGDRPVALKVARAGSREPQTLARLQHTHIVPVHSYRIDPATGLHLLCMPYFGRVTLAHILADPAVNEAIGGSALVAALDRLDAEGAAGSSIRTTGRSGLASRPFARAIAWWGSRLAEALQHAHDRGVLHRDVKPSNVLVTADGMPMLLDFNLAHEPFDAGADDAPAALGGTLAYMSPEHLEALVEGRTDGGDGRSDIYALGVVLFEAMGARPFGPPPESRSVSEALMRAAEQRKAGPPRLRDRFPEVPPALCAVVARCLAPDPADRYARASDLAEDLQAVADDLPLVHAREPIVVRIASKVRRHRRAMAATATVLGALGLAAFTFLHARMADDRLRDQIRYYFAQGDRAETDRNFPQARQDFLTAERLAAGSRDLASERLRATRRLRVVDRAAQTSIHADRFFAQAEALRITLLGFDVWPSDGPTLDQAIAPFFVVASPDWTDRGELLDLGGNSRARLVREVHELLFLDALREAASQNDPVRLSNALRRCDLALSIREARLAAGPSGVEDARSLPLGPWEALRAIIVAKREGSPPPAIQPPPSALLGTAWECYGWGRLWLMDGPSARGRAVAWLDRAARREAPPRFWLAYDAACQADRAGLSDLALEHYGSAITLRPDHTLARLNRARIYGQRGAWFRALEDLERVVAKRGD